MFTSCAQNVHVDCLSKNEGKTGVRTEKRIRSVGRLNSTDDLCGSWRKNSAELYGDDVGTFASTIVAIVRLNGENTTVSNTTAPCRIGPYRSGSHLPVAIKAVDDFAQTPAIGRDHRPVVSRISSPDNLFTGNYSILMDSDLEFNVTHHARPDIYKILFRFGEETLRDFEIEVAVQRCQIGEESSEDKKSCEPCSAATYNFVLDEDSECQPCPDNGNCTTKAIVPNQGYWHSSPCSPHIQKCLTAGACDGENRTVALQAMSEDMDNCSASEWNLKTCDPDGCQIHEYRQAQCAQVAIYVRTSRFLIVPVLRC